MPEQKTPDLPEGTDTVIEGAANSGAITAERVGGNDEDGIMTVENTGRSADQAPAPRQDAEPRAIGGASPETGIAERLRSSREKLAGQAGDKARGLVTQGMERTAEALANVSKMVGDTADGIEERLGPEYGDYARRAAGAIENAANSIAEKNPDELIEDTRNFVRNSPGIALAGAAVVGFVVARLLKSGIASGQDEDDRD